MSSHPELDTVIEESVGSKESQMPRSELPLSRSKRHQGNQKALQLIKRSIKDSSISSWITGKAADNLEGAAGGREALIETLKHCPETSAGYKAARKLIEDAAIADVNMALGALLFKKKVKFEALAMGFKDALSAQLAVQALARLAEHAEPVVEQIATDAKNRYDACPVCEGHKRVKRIADNGEWALDASGAPLTQLCYNCRGTGKIFKEHDVQDRKLFLQITGILSEKSGTTINNVNQNAVINKDFQPGDGSFERLIKAVDLAVNKVPQSEEPLDVPFAVYEESESHNPA